MKKFVVLAAVLAIAVIAYRDFREQWDRPAAEERLKPRGLEVRRHASVGTWRVPGVEAPAAREPQLAPPASAVQPPEGPLEAAERYLRERRRELGLRDYHEFRPSVFQTPLGTKVSYTVLQDGLPILGSEIRLEIGANGEVAEVESSYVPLAPYRPREGDYLTPSQLEEITRQGNYVADPGTGSEPGRVLVPVRGTDRAELAYVVHVRESGGRRRSVQLLLRATDGQILGKSYSRAEF